MDISKELKEQAKACKTAEELMALAKANGIELSTEEADLLLQEFAECELADNELENVAGGKEGCAKPSNPYEVVYFHTSAEVQFLFNVGDRVQAFGIMCQHHTATCEVTDRRTYEICMGKWCDEYYLEKVKGCSTAYLAGWERRNRIER